MKTKVVYVLVSDDRDIYLEQLFVSLYTLLFYNPNQEVILLVDDKTDISLVGFRKEVLKFVTTKIVVDTPKDYDKKLRSRYIKTTMINYINEPFLFIDTDTIISDSLDYFDSVGCDFDVAMCADRHYDVFCTPGVYKKSIDLALTSVSMKFEDLKECYFNSGVIYVNPTRSSKELFNKWNLLWTYSKSNGSSQDQPALAKAIYEVNPKIKKLDGIYNCQITSNAMKYLYGAKIIHYFASVNNVTQNPYLFANDFFFKNIKNKQSLDSNDIKRILDPKTAFVGVSEVCSESSGMVEMNYYSNNYSGLFHFFLRILSLRCNITLLKKKIL